MVYLQRSTALVVSARARKSIRWTAGIALPAKKPKLFTIAPVSREGFTLALFSPWLRPCHFCLVNLEQKKQRKTWKPLWDSPPLTIYHHSLGWGISRVCFVVPRSRFAFERFRRAVPLPLASSMTSLGWYSRGDDNGKGVECLPARSSILSSMKIQIGYGFSDTRTSFDFQRWLTDRSFHLLHWFRKIFPRKLPRSRIYTVELCIYRKRTPASIGSINFYRFNSLARTWSYTNEKS